jgi:hypothetical protein
VCLHRTNLLLKLATPLLRLYRLPQAAAVEAQSIALKGIFAFIARTHELTIFVVTYVTKLNFPQPVNRIS